VDLWKNVQSVKLTFRKTIIAQSLLKIVHKTNVVITLMSLGEDTCRVDAKVELPS